MGIFGNTHKAGGFMDVIRCDEPEYLIWKWHPVGSQQGNNNRENAIRWGSSLRVKDGEVAVFVYNQPNGVIQDYIEGPFDERLETDNLPVLASIIGLAYDGGSPFQAEVYFINMANIIQMPFGVPFFDIFDVRFPDFGVPTAVRGKITFCISDYREFISLHRLSTFDLATFQKQVRDAVSRYVKNVVSNVPVEKGIPVVQVEREISTINDAIEENIRVRFRRDFGVDVTAVDISAIEIDKDSQGYKQLKAVTQDLTMMTAWAQTDVNIKNMYDMQRINAENTEENLRIQREEDQYTRHKQTQMSNFAAFQVEQQSAVGIAGAEALGQMGVNGATEVTGSGTMNPAAMLTGMAMGGVIGKNITGMMNGMVGAMNNQEIQAPNDPNRTNAVTPPPIPTAQFYVAIAGEANGPCNDQKIIELIKDGLLTEETLVWKQGFADWVPASSINELSQMIKDIKTVPPIPQ